LFFVLFSFFDLKKKIETLFLSSVEDIKLQQQQQLTKLTNMPVIAKKKNICRKCGKEGHNRITCGRKSKTRRVKPSGVPHASIGTKRKCKKCGELGHMAKTCGGGGTDTNWAYVKAARERQCESEYEVIIYDPRKRHWEQ